MGLKSTPRAEMEMRSTSSLRKEPLSCFLPVAKLDTSPAPNQTGATYRATSQDFHCRRQIRAQKTQIRVVCAQPLIIKYGKRLADADGGC